MHISAWSIAALLSCPIFVCASAPRSGNAIEPKASVSPKSVKVLAPRAKLAAEEHNLEATLSTETAGADAATVNDTALHASAKVALAAVAADTAPHAPVHVKNHVQHMAVAADGSVLRSTKKNDDVDVSKVVAIEEAVSLNVSETEKQLPSITRSATELNEKGPPSEKAPAPTEAPFPADPTPVQEWQMAIGLSVGGVVLLAVGALGQYSCWCPWRVEKRNGDGDLGQYSCFIAAMFLGLMNHLNYGLLMGRAPALASFFKQEAWGALFPLFMVGACFAGTFMNSVYFCRLRFRIRIFIICGATALGLWMLMSAAGDASTLHFLLVLGACILIGLATVIGEVCCLSFLRDFPPIILGGFGIGTGFATIMGPALMVVLTHGLGYSDGAIFGYLILGVVIYWLAFEHLHSKIEYMRAVYIARGERCYPPPEEPGRIVSPSSTQMLYKTSFGIISCAMLAFFFEFFMYPGLLDRSDGCTNFSQFPVRHGLTVSWLSFHVGVILSRASIAILQVERLWVFPVLQFVNLVACIVVRPSVVFPPAAAVAWMSWIGVVGGCTYVNTMRALQTWPEIPSSLRELAMTVTLMMMMSAIAVASLLTRYLTLVPFFSSLISASATSVPQGCKPVFS